jgi:hypothetical protein
VYQVREPIAEGAGYQQSGQRLFRRVPTQIPSGASALLVGGCRRLTGLASDFASDALDNIPGLRHRLTTRCRHVAYHGSGLVNRLSGACLKILEYSFALIELALHRVRDLRCRISHDIPNLPLVHRSPPYYRTLSKQSAGQNTPRENFSVIAIGLVNSIADCERLMRVFQSDAGYTAKDFLEPSTELGRFQCNSLMRGEGLKWIERNAGSMEKVAGIVMDRHYYGRVTP